jgi:hypothetical protein
MKRLKTTQKMVRTVLEKDKEARNDDMLLYLQVCKVCLKDAETMSLAEVMTRYKHYGFPHFESVRRARQKLQATCPELAGNLQIRQIRATQEKVYRDYAKK